MSCYKTAKEAFVADNPGATILSINAVSLAALSSYTLYAVATRRFRPRPALDYATTVLPLSLAVTIASSYPITFNIFLVIVAGISSRTAPWSRREFHLSGHGSKQKQSTGKWLDESDSDEEPAVPTLSSPFTNRMTIRLPSEVVPTASSTALSPSSSPNLSPEVPRSFGSRRRRHSPTLSTYTHTAIDVLPTPELAGSSSLSSASKSFPSPTSRDGGKPSGDRLPFLSVYRAHMMVMTIHCILAVDFPVFPRWQGKCEDFGTSLMDVGVGSFVFSLGIVSVRSFTEGLSPGKPLSTPSAVFKTLRKAAPVLALGVVRVLMVKGSDYPEHVTEYGVHWNFFFTLGLLPVFGVLLWPVRQKWMRWTILGLLLTIVHQLALSITSLQTWALATVRTGLLSQNKEGLVSLPGYLAIYVLGLASGEHILRSTSPIRGRHNDEDDKRHHEKRRTELALELFSYSVAWWVALAVWRLMGGEVSRRLANLPYMLWVAAYNTTFLLSYLVIELLFSPDRPVPSLLEAINENGLAIFLAANLLTGLINLSMKTMYADDFTSMIVLVGYSGAVCSIAWLGRGYRLKL